MKQFNRILLATDFTPASTPAIEKAIEIAKENGAKLLIAHAYDPPNLTQAESVAPGVYEEWDQNLRTLVERKLQPLVEGARRQLVDAQALALPGSPHEAIVEAAKHNQADLVVMGTHGRTGVSRFFLGSVAARVIATAPCPVMTVRVNPEAAARRPPVRSVRSHPAGPRRVRAAIEEDR